MRWTRENTPPGMESACDAQWTSLRARGRRERSLTPGRQEQMLVSKVRRRAASSDVAGKGSE